MTLGAAVPDKLVQVATQAIRERFQAGELGGMEGAARAALAAAFAALPEFMKAEVISDDDDPSWAEGWNDCLAAIAQEFGEPTPTSYAGTYDPCPHD